MKISLSLSNYYGEVVAYETGEGNFYMELGNWSGDDVQEISEEFFRAIQKEFGGSKTK